MKRLFTLCFSIAALCVIPVFSYADSLEAMKVQRMNTGLGANDLGEIAWDGEKLWVTGSGTLNQLTGYGNHIHDWMTFESMEGFGRGTMSAIYADKNVIVLAWTFSETHDDGYLYSSGDAFSISTDDGATWRKVDVVDIFPERSEFKYPGSQTITWDIEASGSTLWASTTAGYLLRTDDYGETWTHYYPNTDELNLTNLNHHGFSVEAYGDTLWVGTMLGLNSSFDGGETWTNYSWPLDGSADADADIPGNFVPTLEHNVTGGKTHIWVGSQRELANTGMGRDGICHSDDNGVTWEYKAPGYKAWNFAFGWDGASDSRISSETVFAATDSGLIVSYDLGDNWETMDIQESDDNSWEAGALVSAVTVVENTLWVTSTNGIARSDDWGKTWRLFRGITRVRTLDTGNDDIGIANEFDNVETYAFPNPITPQRSDRDYSRTRIYYSLENDHEITVKIYDYRGRLIRNLVDGESRSGGREYQEVWDGTDSDNRIVPNGVYFYVIENNRGDSARGKIMVLD